MSADKDPWADLAESLGAAPGPESAPPPRAAQPPRPAPPRPAPKPSLPTGGTGDWNNLAANLGLEQPRETAEPRPPQTTGHAPRESTAEQTAETPADRGERTVRPARREREAGDASGEASGEGRGRRRRGRRGGRGRGRREEGREGPREGEARRRDDAPPSRDLMRDEQEPDHADQGFADDVFDESLPAARSGEDASRDEARDEEGHPARRRRRGRRGGRRRGRGGRERLADERANAEEPASQQTEDDFDEPLPTGYGAVGRSQPAPRSEEPRSGEGETGEMRGRRRRRRRGGSGTNSGERRTSEAGREAPGTSGREPTGRSSRRRGEGSRSSSRPPRSRRDDFAPVAGRFEEDDEGLEFLGVEEASRSDAPAREKRPQAEDDILAESGLDTVREVPSWVEAIGIVIAGNLDARNKSGPRK
jgi:ribonuclease E